MTGMWQFLAGLRAQLLMPACLIASVAFGMSNQDAGALLKSTDDLKMSDPASFAANLKALQTVRGQLSPAQQEYLRYLTYWQTAYQGNYQGAITDLDTLIETTRDTDLRFRAGATVVNILAVASQYEKAFTRLDQLLTSLPAIRDPAVRELGISVAALLYAQVGQYDLALNYATQLVKTSSNAVTVCRGGQLQLEALFRTNALSADDQRIQSAVDACTRVDENIYANLIRTYPARLRMAAGKSDEAIRLLSDRYEEVVRADYPRLTSEYDALLAEAWYRGGNLAEAGRFASLAVEHAVKNEFTEPLSAAYRLLYLVAKQQGDMQLALGYHEKYASADKGYLNDVSARQLAYQRARHALTANELQIDALNKQNEVLQLQRENGSLYTALLILVLSFIGYWAYKTKLSQLHFMKLSRHDGLTGIFNRPHFIDQANHALRNAEEQQLSICIVLCDLDHFKSINDRHGHATGDLVLRQTVAACQLHLEPHDLFGRFGGEEFGILLHGCEVEEAQQRLEQMRISIARVSANSNPADVGVSASFGLTATSTSGYELRQLLADADAALYQAKRSGRNRVAVFHKEARDADDRSAAA